MIRLTFRPYSTLSSSYDVGTLILDAAGRIYRVNGVRPDRRSFLNRVLGFARAFIVIELVAHDVTSQCSLDSVRAMVADGIARDCPNNDLQDAEQQAEIVGQCENVPDIVVYCCCETFPPKKIQPEALVMSGTVKSSKSQPSRWTETGTETGTRLVCLSVVNIIDVNSPRRGQLR